jgi:hypothetical protein
MAPLPGWMEAGPDASGERAQKAAWLLMGVTAGEPVPEESLKGLLNRFGVFALGRGQVSPSDERIESSVGHANLAPLKFVVAVPRATRR